MNDDAVHSAAGKAYVVCLVQLQLKVDAGTSFYHVVGMTVYEHWQFLIASFLSESVFA